LKVKQREQAVESSNADVTRITNKIKEKDNQIAQAIAKKMQD
jgi:Trp operon repressor